MQTFFVLDFDGVLFNSAFEAYSVANKATAGKPEYRQGVTYEEFLVFRGVVTDAWHYNRLYHREYAVPVDEVPSVSANEADWTFAQDFFEARRLIMEDPDWPKVMPPYDFFFLVQPLLLKYPDRFAILSTRNLKSIRETLLFHGVDNIPVFGQEDIRRHGSKLAVALDQHWLDSSKLIVIYVDDMSSHLEPFDGQIHLPLHADWGYGTPTLASLSANHIFEIINSLLSITEKEKR